jgi:type II secretory pathway predicted ATPase ExeA
MYQPFFKLQRRPFSATPDPNCVYQAGAVQTAIDELVVRLERGEGIAVLTAPAGLGKTLLCEKIKEELGGHCVAILLRHADFRSTDDLLRTLLIELGDPSAVNTEPELRRRLKATLTDLREQRRSLVLICDEAHGLENEVLEELRRLVDYADHGVAWVRILLAGQLELEEKLADPRLSAVNQRLQSHLTLSPLSQQESRDYIDYRITWAGGRVEEVFHPEALSAIVEAADGNPRCLNQLCDHVLLLAYVAEQRPVLPELVSEALSDLQHLPLSWHVRSPRSMHATSVPGSVSGKQNSTVEFGNHLKTWESRPTFLEADLPDQETVWEFGSPEPGELPTVAEPADPFEHLLQEVETELDRIEALEHSHRAESDEVREEPVLDRYAAIDAGWPAEEFPPPEVYAPEPDISPARPANTDAESRIHAEVLELVSTARQATGARRFDGASSDSHVWETESSLPAVETQPPAAPAARPFRNLFTRLRRKQRGME